MSRWLGSLIMPVPTPPVAAVDGQGDQGHKRKGWSRIGVFGGTFDPPHVGHLVIAVNVRYALALDVVLLVVANVPWQKSGARTISDVADRLAMVESAVGGVDGLEVSDIEIRRGGPSYTADTLAALRDEHRDAELFVILGADAAAGLATWERVEAVRDLATIVVVDRPGAATSPPLPGFRWCRVEAPHLEVSSTDLRARVSDGRPLDYLVPDAVLDQIVVRKLYRAA
jgi:nicotinate-nucleotide adenylyltransferase